MVLDFFVDVACTSQCPFLGSWAYVVFLFVFFSRILAVIASFLNIWARYIFWSELFNKVKGKKTTLIGTEVNKINEKKNCKCLHE